MVQRPPRVVVDDPEHMVLLGLLLRGLLTDKLADDAAFSRARSLHGEVAVKAGEMEVRLRFEHDAVRITRDASHRPSAHVSGDMKALLDVVAGGPMLRPVLARSIRAGGNPLFLLRVLSLLRSPQARVASA